MVTVVNATGIASGATTAIDLSDYLEEGVARLVGVRTLARAAQAVAFAGVAVAAHTHNVEAEPAHTHVVEAEPAHMHAVESEAAHTHNVEAEAAHTHAIVTIGNAAWSGAGHSHTGSVQAAGAFTPTVNAAGAFTPTVAAAGAFTPTVAAAGAFTPTVNAGGGHTPAGTVGVVAGLVHTELAVQAFGLMDVTYLTPGPGSVALTGRKAIMMGDALASTTVLELRVLYFRECAGVF